MLLDILSNVFFYLSFDEDIWWWFEENLLFIDLNYFDEIIWEYIFSLFSDDYFKDMVVCYREVEIIVFNVIEGFWYEFFNYIEYVI